ncbi:MAG TPA: hypothetical protein VEZ14_14080 [Dehalococcoidia bacterium]|nr:hypothetical protein [Dehalococcoidia bacterium]
MRPYPEEVLRAIQAGMMAHLAPEVASTYGKAQLTFAMMLFSIALRDYDGAVPELLEANRTLRALLADAAAATNTLAGERAREAGAALAGMPAEADSLRLSALRAERDALRAVVSKLAPLIERAGEDTELAALRPVRRALFEWLRADAQRRAVPILSA